MDTIKPQNLSPSQIEGLFAEYGIEYLDRTEYRIELNDRQQYKSSYYLNYQEEFEALENKYAEKIRDSYVAPCNVAYLGPGLNYGLYASEALSEGEFLAEYTGIVGPARRHRKMKDKLGGYSTDYAWTYPVRKFWRRLELDGRLQGNETRFINHSFKANVRMEHCLVDRKWVLFLLVEKPILPGEQICVNYGEEYWTGGKRELYLI